MVPLSRSQACCAEIDNSANSLHGKDLTRLSTKTTLTKSKKPSSANGFCHLVRNGAHTKWNLQPSAIGRQPEGASQNCVHEFHPCILSPVPCPLFPEPRTLNPRSTPLARPNPARYNESLNLVPRSSILVPPRSQGVPRCPSLPMNTASPSTAARSPSPKRKAPRRRCSTPPASPKPT